MLIGSIEPFDEMLSPQERRARNAMTPRAFTEQEVLTFAKRAYEEGRASFFCCGTTARQAYERGFKVVFGSDITATDDPTLQEPELQVLRKGFAKVESLDEILEWLQ